MWSQLLLGLVLMAAPEVQVRTLDGNSAKGSLENISSQQIVLNQQGTSRTFLTNNLQTIQVGTAPVVSRDALLVELSDGTQFQAKQYTAADGTSTIETTGGMSVTLPSSKVAALRLGRETETLLKEWEELKEKKTASDLLVIQKEEALDYLEGVIGAIDEERINFAIPGREIKANREKVYGIFFYQRAGRQLPESICQVVDVDGSRYEVRELKLTDQGLAITTPSGAEFTRKLSGISSLDYTRGKIVYLSDLKPLNLKETPFYDIMPASTRFDTNLEGGKLKIGSQEFEKGLALHSRTEVEYYLGGKYRTLKAVVGIDELVGNQGHAELIISSERGQHFATQLTGSEAPRPIDIDVSQVQRLRILVDFGKDRDVADHVNLCDAKVIK